MQELLFKRGLLPQTDYEICERIGAGGFGVVYLVKIRKRNTYHALKAIREDLLPTVQVRELFQNEALLWSGISRHLCIVNAEFVQEWNGRLLIQMEYVARDAVGRVTLAEHLEQSPRGIDHVQALFWGVQFCWAMEHALAHGVCVHRDIKPGNILITQDGVLKLSDFGLAIAAARTVIEGNSMSATQQKNGRISIYADVHGRTVCGTPGYMAPEIYDGRMADAGSDIFAFGMVLWQMGSGSVHPPFWQELCRMGNASPEAVSRRLRNWSPAKLDVVYWDVIEKCLQYDRRSRYKGFADLRADLDRILASLEKTITYREGPSFTVSDMCNQSTCLAVLGKDEEALAVLERAFSLDPNDRTVLQNMGIVLSKLGRHDEALSCLELAVKLDPDNVLGWLAKSRALERLGRFPDALVICDTLLAKLGRDPQALFQKAGVLCACDRRQEALSVVEEIIELVPSHLAAWTLKAVALNHLGKFSDACAACDRVIDIDPHHEEALLWKAISMQDAGMDSEAMPILDIILGINHRNPFALYRKANWCAQQGKHSEAIKLFEHLLEVEPNHSYAWNNLGSAWMAIGQLDIAHDCWLRAVAADQQNMCAICNLGHSFFIKGNKREALAQVERALQLDSNFDMALRLRAAVNAAGEFPEAPSH